MLTKILCRKGFGVLTRRLCSGGGAFDVLTKSFFFKLLLINKNLRLPLQSTDRAVL